MLKELRKCTDNLNWKSTDGEKVMIQDIFTLAK